jgi:nucleoid-associated protein YgaU
MKKRPNKHLAPGQPPQPLKWRPRFRILGMLSGLIGGLGTVILVQQYGIAPLSRALTVQGLAGGVMSGIVMPSAVFAVVVPVHNRRLARSMARTAALRAPTMRALVLLVMGAAMVAPFVGAPTAFADVSGPCGGRLNGIDLSTVRPTAGDAIEISEGDTVSGFVFVDDDIIGGRVGLSLMGRQVTVIDEPPDAASSEGGDGGDASFEIEYDDISWIGAGLIELWAIADLAGGGTCEIRFMVDIDGDPLDTVLGRAAAGAVGVAAVGMTLSVTGSLLEGGRVLGDLRRAVSTFSVESPGFEAFDPSSVDPVGGDTTVRFNLQVESDAEGSGGLAPPGSTIGEALSDPGVDQTVVVQPGDNLWQLSENELENRLGRPPTDAETAQYWQQVVDANVDHLPSGDPDLIYPGDEIVLPGGTSDSLGAPSGGDPQWWQESGEVGGDGVAVSDASEVVGGDAVSVSDAPEAVGGDGVSVPDASEAVGGDGVAASDAPGVDGPERTVVREGAGSSAGGDRELLREAVSPEGGVGDGTIAGLVGATGAAAFVAAIGLSPARNLLVARLAGTVGPDDPRLRAEVDAYLAGLPIDDPTRASLDPDAITADVDAIHAHVAATLMNDLGRPRSQGPLAGWPPRAASAVAWMRVGDTGLAPADVDDLLQTSAYLADVLAGTTRSFDRFEQKAVWPWTDE